MTCGDKPHTESYQYSALATQRRVPARTQAHHCPPSDLRSGAASWRTARWPSATSACLRQPSARLATPAAGYLRADSARRPITAQPLNNRGTALTASRTVNPRSINTAVPALSPPKSLNPPAKSRTRRLHQQVSSPGSQRTPLRPTAAVDSTLHLLTDQLLVAEHLHPGPALRAHLAKSDLQGLPIPPHHQLGRDNPAFLKATSKQPFSRLQANSFSQGY